MSNISTFTELIYCNKNNEESNTCEFVENINDGYYIYGDFSVNKKVIKCSLLTDGEPYCYLIDNVVAERTNKNTYYINGESKNKVIKCTDVECTSLDVNNKTIINPNRSDDTESSIVCDPDCMYVKVPKDCSGKSDVGNFYFEKTSFLLCKEDSRTSYYLFDDIQYFLVYDAVIEAIFKKAHDPTFDSTTIFKSNNLAPFNKVLLRGISFNAVEFYQVKYLYIIDI